MTVPGGRPVLSGAIHYFRVHPAYWRDRLIKLKACGFNTVETYIPWNFHQPKEGRFQFEGFGDVRRFIETAAELGLSVIVRPGPYICAEWDFGGLPAWLNRDAAMRLRCSWPPFLQKVRNWFAVLIPMLTPYLCTKGGPIVAMQVENEYGSYGKDEAYLRFLRDLLRELGVDCLLFTSDGARISMLDSGTLPDLQKTVNFGSDPEESFAVLRKFQPQGPDMCAEFWCGWFDHWGEAHHTREAADVADMLERIVAGGGAVNMYMFHGGTNFGFYNGANFDQTDGYQPTTTSYDYHALLNEAGDITPAYTACKAVLEKVFGRAPALSVANTEKLCYGSVSFKERYALWDFLPAPVAAACPLTMEELGQEYGYLLYRTVLHIPEGGETLLKIRGLRDRAVVFCNGIKAGVLYRNDPQGTVALPRPPSGGVCLDILVENMGRVNYGPELGGRCGISGSVLLGNQNVYGWEMFPLPFEDLPVFGAAAQTEREGPAFYRSTFEADRLCDTFLDTTNFQKGIAFVNGFHLGRYWEIGPARTLYIPAPLLRKGQNELVLFETDGCADPQATLTDRHIWISE